MRLHAFGLSQSCVFAAYALPVAFRSDCEGVTVYVVATDVGRHFARLAPRFGMAEKHHIINALNFFSFDYGWPTNDLACGLADRMSVLVGKIPELAHHLLLRISGGTSPPPGRELGETAANLHVAGTRIFE